jgi:hypothetical protein
MVICHTGISYVYMYMVIYGVIIVPVCMYHTRYVSPTENVYPSALVEATSGSERILTDG